MATLRARIWVSSIEMFVQIEYNYSGQLCLLRRIMSMKISMAFILFYPFVLVLN